MWTWSSTASGVLESGTADFSTQVDAVSGFDLVIVLVNNSTVKATASAQILDGLYFDLSSGGAASSLSMYSATADLGLLTDSTSFQKDPTTATAGTNMCAPGTGAGTASAPNSTNCTVADGWQAAYNSSGLNGGAKATQQYGIGTTGQGGVFNGNGAQAGSFGFGIAPTAGVDPTTKGNGLEGAYPPGYTYQQGTFVLRGFTTANITVANVAGAYGTAPEATPAGTIVVNTATPEPASAGLFIGGLLLGLGLLRQTAVKRQSV